MAVLIFANGDVEELQWVRPCLEEAAAVIAADGGTRHLHALRYAPDVVIGDLDSLPQQVQDWLGAEGVEIAIYPHAKDETDLELALLYAVSHYDEDISIIGAMGGRLDQTLGNIMLLAHPALEGRRVELLTRHQRAWLVKEQTEITGQVGDTVSLIPIGGDVRVRQTRGLRWPLEQEILTFGPARGVSNTMTEQTAHIVIDGGALLCVHTDHSWRR